MPRGKKISEREQEMAPDTSEFTSRRSTARKASESAARKTHNTGAGPVPSHAHGGKTLRKRWQQTSASVKKGAVTTPKGFLNETEQQLTNTLKNVMNRHKPSKGFWGKVVKKARQTTTGPKPQDAHNLSVFVTEDFLTECALKFSGNTGSAFMSVMSIADKEAMDHYTKTYRSPTFAKMLEGVRDAYRAGTLGNLFELDDTFVKFVEEFIEDDDDITLEKGLSVQKKDASGSHQWEKEDLLASAMDILRGDSYRVLSVNWLLLRSLATAYIKLRREKRLYLPEDCPSDKELGEMFTLERKCMINLYGSALFSAYAEDIQREAQEAFKKANPVVSKSLAFADSVGKHNNKILSAYVLCMIGAILCGAMGVSAAPVLGPILAAGATISILPKLPLLGVAAKETYQNIAEQFARMTGAQVNVVNETIQISMPAAAGAAATAGAATVGTAAAAAPAVAAAGAAAPVAAATGAAAAGTAAAALSPTAKFAAAMANNTTTITNYAGMPATATTLIMMYAVFPRIMFSGYQGKWISKYIETDGSGEFDPPSLISPLVASMGIKLFMNTMLCVTPHLKNEALFTVLGLSLYRLYLPLSLIEQPSKVKNFYEVAMSVSARQDRSDFTYSNKTSIAACVGALAVEFGLHCLSTFVPGVPPGMIMALQSLLRCARIAGWAGPIWHARRKGNVEYTNYFERLFWTDGVKALTAPAILGLFEVCAPYPIANTALLTSDIVVSVFPDMKNAQLMGALTKASGRLAALSSFMRRNNISPEQVLELCVATSMEENPEVAEKTLQRILEKYLSKDQYKDLGLDGIIDDDEEDEELEQEQEEKAPRKRIAFEEEDWGDEDDLLNKKDLDFDQLSKEDYQKLLGIPLLGKDELTPAQKRDLLDNGFDSVKEEDYQQLFGALSKKHPFLSLISSGNNLTEEEEEAIRESTRRYNEFSDKEKAKINRSVDKFERHYQNQLASQFTESQKQGLLVAVENFEEEYLSSLPDVLTKEQRNSIRRSLQNFKDRLKGIAPDLEEEEELEYAVDSVRDDFHDGETLVASRRGAAPSKVIRVSERMGATSKSRSYYGEERISRHASSIRDDECVRIHPQSRDTTGRGIRTTSSVAVPISSLEGSGVPFGGLASKMLGSEHRGSTRDYYEDVAPEAYESEEEDEVETGRGSGFNGRVNKILRSGKGTGARDQEEDEEAGRGSEFNGRVKKILQSDKEEEVDRRGSAKSVTVPTKSKSKREEEPESPRARSGARRARSNQQQEEYDEDQHQPRSSRKVVKKINRKEARSSHGGSSLSDRILNALNGDSEEDLSEMEEDDIQYRYQSASTGLTAPRQIRGRGEVEEFDDFSDPAGIRDQFGLSSSGNGRHLRVSRYDVDDVHEGAEHVRITPSFGYAGGNAGGSGYYDEEASGGARRRNVKQTSAVSTRARGRVAEASRSAPTRTAAQHTQLTERSSAPATKSRRVNTSKRPMSLQEAWEGQNRPGSRVVGQSLERGGRNNTTRHHP
ncbi:MAG: Cpg1 family polymorphic protein [Anaplasma sp.]